MREVAMQTDVRRVHKSSRNIGYGTQTHSIN